MTNSSISYKNSPVILYSPNIIEIKKAIDNNGQTSVKFALSVEAVDRQNEIVSVSGINLKNYANNPMVLWNHDFDEPIGKGVNLYVSGPTLYGEVIFDRISERSQITADKVEAGFLKAVSIGFIPLSYHDVPITEGMRTSGTYYPGKDFIRIIDESELLEFSVCSVQANQYALIQNSYSKFIQNLNMKNNLEKVLEIEEKAGMSVNKDNVVKIKSAMTHITDVIKALKTSKKDSLMPDPDASTEPDPMDPMEGMEPAEPNDDMTIKALMLDKLNAAHKHLKSVVSSNSKPTNVTNNSINTKDIGVDQVGNIEDVPEDDTSTDMPVETKAIKVNPEGLTNANSLIDAGKVNTGGDWSFSSEDGNKLLGSDTANPDFTTYGSFHLALNDSADKNTEAAYEYPFGKDGEVYRSAIVAIRQRAGQQKETDIFDAAGKLLQKIDGENAPAKSIEFNDELQNQILSNISMKILNNNVKQFSEDIQNELINKLKIN